MNVNELLKNNVDYMSQTLIKILKTLVDKEIITVVKGNARAGIENFYTINSIRWKVDNVININYFAINMCILG